MGKFTGFNAIENALPFYVRCMYIRKLAYPHFQTMSLTSHIYNGLANTKTAKT